MWKEFQTFAVKGNAIDLAVAVIVGAAFSGIVTSLVNDIIMPPIGVLTGGVDFKDFFFVLKPFGAHFATLADATTAKAVTLNIGKFVNTLIQFLIIGFSVFLLVRALSKMKTPEPNAAPTAKDCPFCAMTISVKAARCPHCTSALTS